MADNSRSTDSILDYKLKITNVTLKKINGESIDISGLMVQLELFQSIFQPVMKATMMLSDAVSLHTKFPLIGEETIEVTYLPSKQGSVGVANSMEQENDEIGILKFCIDKIHRQEVSEQGKNTVYILNLYSLEMLDNIKKRVQSAYNTTYTEAIRILLDNELNMSKNGKSLKGMTDGDEPEKSRGSFTFIVPNLKPIEAILWMNKRAVPVDPTNFYFVFFERFDGFYFNTIQQMINYQRDQTIKSGGVENNRTIKDYYYITGYNENTKSTINLPENAQQRIITGLKINKRYSTFEKILGGFFENEYYEIDIYNKKVISTQSKLGDLEKRGGDRVITNSQDFIDSQLTADMGPGTKTRIKYAIVQNRGDYPNAPNYFADKYNEALRVQTGFSQINITATALGDTRIQAGDVINIKIPDQSGFNAGSGLDPEDKYLTGIYLITDIKYNIITGGDHVMVMNLNRNSFTTEIENKNQYGFEGTDTSPPSSTINPAREN